MNQSAFETSSYHPCVL